MKRPRIIFIHGNQTTHWSWNWTPWLKAELDRAGFETDFQTFPDSIIGRAQYWLPFLEEHLRAGEHDVLVGCSTGAVAAMRYAEQHRYRGSVLISPSYTDLGDDLERQSGYFDTPWQWGTIRAHQDRIALFYGDDDPYIPQNEFEFIAGQLKPEVFKVAGGRHFIERQEFPEVRDYLLAAYR